MEIAAFIYIIEGIIISLIAMRMLALENSRRVSSHYEPATQSFQLIRLLSHIYVVSG
jgi:hypothetical protein